jgi:transposase
MLVDWADNFEELYKKNGQQRYGIRLLALAKIQAGITEKDVCKILGKTPKTIRTWRRLYEAEGLEGLLSLKAGRGRKARIPDEPTLKAEIIDLQKNLPGGRVKCQTIVDMVAQKYGVLYSQPGMYHLLERLGFSWITARSKHPKQSPEAQEEFKKKIP